MPTENRSTHFQREGRYIVIKLSDLANVPVNYRSALVDPIFHLQAHLPRRECLVIESDWPEYEPTWAAIEARVAGKPTEQHQGKPVTLPKRKDPTQHWVEPGGVHKAEGWNACLDEIAKLGPLYTHVDPEEQPLHGFPKYGQTMLDALKQGKPFTVTPHDPANGKGYDLKIVDHCADPGEVERLSQIIRDINEERDEPGALTSKLRAEVERKAANADLALAAQTKQVHTLRAQLVEAQTLLRAWLDTDLGKSSPAINDLRGKTDYTLSASAEPSPAKCEACHGNGVIGWRRGQTAESYEEGESPCEECKGTGAGAPVERDELVSEDELRDMASIACQSALAHGISEDWFMQLARSVEQRARAALERKP